MLHEARSGTTGLRKEVAEETEELRSGVGLIVLSKRMLQVVCQMGIHEQDGRDYSY